MTANADGSWNSTLQYTAFGEVRAKTGITHSDYRYTGQLSQMDEIGLMYYVARWYDPSIMMFSSPDTFIPDPNNPLDWNRYGYVRNNPLVMVDKTGHVPQYIPGWDAAYMQLQKGNTCAVVSAAVAVSILTGNKYTQQDLQLYSPLTYIKIGVVPQWQADSINNLGLSVHATYSHGTRADLMNNFNNGNPTLVTLAFNDLTVGHVVVVVGYDPATNELIFFDPAYKDIQTESQLLNRYDKNRGYTTFDQLWAAENRFIDSNSMVTVERKEPDPLLPVISANGGGRNSLIANVR